VKLYLENGADPKLTADDGTTALMVAAGIGWVEGVTYEWSPAQTLETARLMVARGLPVPPEGRTLDSICVVEICK